jgi:protein-L-isoaspartate(D-aspartate) O-methyltransferase
MQEILTRPRAVHPAAQRMVGEQLAGRGISDERVLAAMSTLPRHMFMPVPVRDQAYEDHAVPIGFEQTISQPFIVGWMSEVLGLRGDERALEVGTGSGYQAAVLGLLAREVYTIERHAVLARRARWTLRALGIENVHVFIGDGSVGLPAHAPFDSILVAAAAPEVPDALVDQLAPGGRLVVPVGRGMAQALRLIRRTDRGVSVTDVGGCVFVPLVGRAGFPPTPR